MLRRDPIEITKTYHPKYAKPRTVTVSRIPALALTADAESDIGIEFHVADRIQTLVKRALDANAEPHQQIVYSASDSAVAAPVK